MSRKLHQSIRASVIEMKFLKKSVDADASNLNNSASGFGASQDIGVAPRLKVFTARP
jgi:hypothetical protein